MSWEQRYHPLRQEWVVIAAHRQHRPWSGETVKRRNPSQPEYRENCYLCPGNRRVSGKTNPVYEGVFVFDNDLPCVGRDAPVGLAEPPGIYRNRPAEGVARVVCYTPRHNATLTELPVGQIDALLAAWQEQYLELGSRPEVAHVLVFENKGEEVGVSDPHPHGQIYATNFVFKTIEVERNAAANHFEQHRRPLFQDIIAAELADDERRLVAKNDSALAFVPYFARYPYETYVAPRECHPSVAALSAGERRDLAGVLKEVLVRFDNLWRISFPYVLVLHQAPTDGRAHPGFHFHIQIHPPLRTPNLLKYLAGPEIGGGNFLNDRSPEETAAELRAVPSTHYAAAEA